MRKILRLSTKDEGEIILDHVEEYACGYLYFYVKHGDYAVDCFSRSDLYKVERKMKDGSFRLIHLKKPR